MLIPDAVQSQFWLPYAANLAVDVEGPDVL
jgi:hypothetical protein